MSVNRTKFTRARYAWRISNYASLREQNATTDELSIKSTGLGRIAVPHDLRQDELLLIKRPVQQ
ncbi:MAG: hypothetical protein AB7S93_20455 [Xanthobacteraceae bacterium]